MSKQRVTSEWLYLFPEGEMWIAACRFYDVVVQGKTKEEAIERFFRTFSIEVLWRAEDRAAGGRAELLPPPPPPEVVEEWRRRHAEAHFQTNSSSGQA